jgi:hypothetical protein
MRFATVLALLALTLAAYAQQSAGQKATTVPLTLDHNRVIIDVSFPLPGGSTQAVRAWVDNGTPDLTMSRHLATELNLKVTCDDKTCSAPPPDELTIGEMKIPLTSIKSVQIPLKPVSASPVMAPGMPVEANIPSTILRNYDVLVDFPDAKFTLAQPGTLKFQGVSGKVEINHENGLTEVSSEIENKKYNLALDLGSSISFLSDDLFTKLAASHPDWPHMTGAVGPANMWGSPEEPTWKLMRLERLQFGPLHLASVPFVEFPKSWEEFFQKRAEVSTAGLLGSEALLNYRVGLDYAHSMVYFDIGRLVNIPDFDVVGLTLRPEDDGRFTVLGVADYDGKTSVEGVQPGDYLVAIDGNPITHFTMGQVWSLLQASPGQQRELALERGGRKFDAAATVQTFLEEQPEEDGKRKSKRN